MSERGFTLIEAVCALAVLAMAILGLAPTFQALVRTNGISEQRSNAVAAAQQVMEHLREASPGAMPMSGSENLDAVRIGEHEYEIVAHYCRNNAYCRTNMRHICLEVRYGGKVVYELETVYTDLH